MHVACDNARMTFEVIVLAKSGARRGGILVWYAYHDGLEVMR